MYWIERSSVVESAHSTWLSTKCLDTKFIIRLEVQVIDRKITAIGNVCTISGCVVLVVHVHYLIESPLVSGEIVVKISEMGN